MLVLNIVHVIEMHGKSTTLNLKTLNFRFPRCVTEKELAFLEGITSFDMVSFCACWN
jgi:hypothetical protein